MLEHISATRIREIAGLARRAADAHGQLIDKLQITGQEEKDEIIRERLTHFDALDATIENRPLKRLQEAVEALRPEERQELAAIMLTGRGDFTAAEWENAMVRAEALDSSRITDRILLHSYLMKGLYELKLT